MHHFKHSLFAMLSLLLAGCGDSEADACGKGQVYRDGACEAEVPAQTGGTGGAPVGTGGAAVGAGGDLAAMGGSADAAPAFGAACEDHTDCEAPTDYCVVSPFGAAYCSASGCDSDASVCPEGWTCFDVSQFAPGEPFVCAQPM